MMRKITQILIVIITFVAVNTVAQTSDKVDVKAIVKAQMLKAQGSELVTKNSVESQVDNNPFPKISSTLFSFLIFILGSIIILSLVFLRRVKIQHKLISKQFKENIRLIREEKFIPEPDFSLTPVRQGLLGKIEACLEEQSITALARKLRIAKGELILVNNIKNYGSDKNIARNQV